MILWAIAGLLGLATGLRIGWALVNKQSIVSAAMMLALSSLGLLAALNWPPLTLLIDDALSWPNISIALSQVALIFCAASSCVMISSAASWMKPAITRRLAWMHYVVAAVIGATTVALFFGDGRQPEMSPEEYLRLNLGSHTSLPWLLPLLFVAIALAVVAVAGVRYSSPSRRGRALFVFTLGIALIVLSSGFFILRAVGIPELVGVRPAVTLLALAMLMVAAGALLPTVEDWFGAWRELHVIDPLLRELGRRQPDVGVGVRPRGPLTFRVAERMSLISDALFLEATMAAEDQPDARAAVVDRTEGAEAAEPTRVMMDVDLPNVSPEERAEAIAKWVHATKDGQHSAAFPGPSWLRQPENYSDREWILTIARRYRAFERTDTIQSKPPL